MNGYCSIIGCPSCAIEITFETLMLEFPFNKAAYSAKFAEVVKFYFAYFPSKCLLFRI